MVEQDPWILLKSPNAVDRLHGARILAERGQLSDGETELAKRKYRAEPDYFVRRALATLTRGTQSPSAGQTAMDGDELSSASELHNDAEAEAIAEITQMLLHELKPIVGRLDDDARLEVRNFEASQTRHNIERLRSLLAAIKVYGQAAATPTYVEFDLTESVTASVLQLREHSSSVVLARQEPVPAVGDWSLIEIAFQNGLMNAGESTKWSPKSITVNWSRTDRDFWIAIIDQGPGMNGDPELAFRPGATSKDEHDGFGLTNARRSMASTGGSVTLSTAGSFGARFEIRWPFPSDLRK